MAKEQDHETAAGTNWLERKLVALEAIYQRFGSEGLKDQKISDIGLLLSSKELKLRDSPKRELNDEQRAANRQLELEIQDLTAHLKSQIGGISIANLRSFQQPGRASQPDQQRQFKPKDRGHGMERQ